MSATFEEEHGLMLVAIPRDVIGLMKNEGENCTSLDW
jgi:hypothetical protein